MRVEIRDISLRSVLKVGCLVNSIMASVPAIAVTLIALGMYRDSMFSPAPGGQTTAVSYLTVMGWIIVSVIVATFAWIVLAVVYNLVSSFAGGIVVELERGQSLAPIQQPALPPQDMHPEYPDSLPPTAFEVDDQGAIHVAVRSGDHVPYDKPAIPYEKPVVTAKQETHYWEGRWKHK